MIPCPTGNPPIITPNHSTCIFKTVSYLLWCHYYNTPTQREYPSIKICIHHDRNSYFKVFLINYGKRYISTKSIHYRVYQTFVALQRYIPHFTRMQSKRS